VTCAVVGLGEEALDGIFAVFFQGEELDFA